MANRPAQTQSDGSQGPYNVLESTDGGAQMAGEPTACVIVQGGDGRREMGVVQMGTQARQALVKRAKDAADKVRRWGDVVELEPMNAFERRIVHQAIKDDPDIETHSVEVDGTEKKAILLRPKH